MASFRRCHRQRTIRRAAPHGANASSFSTGGSEQMQQVLRARLRAAGVVVLAVVGAVGVPAAHADGPGVGTATIVAVGDSYISGESGRWAGNASSESYVDALGPTA